MIIKLQDFKSELEELEFSIPENARFSGRLMIIGGSHQSFKLAADALSISINTGAARSVLALPDNLKRLLPSPPPPNISLLASERNGSFNLDAAHDLLSLSLASGAVLISGELGRGSQTAQAILGLVKELSIPVIISADANLFLQNEDFYLSRENIFLFLNLGLAQRLLGRVELIRFSDPPNIIEQKLEAIAAKTPVNLCFVLEAWLYALINKQVYRIKLKLESDEPGAMSAIAAKFAAIKTWSKKDDFLNLMLASQEFFR